MIRQSLRSGLAVALATVLFSFAYASTARASVIYDWAGDCTSGCTGTATSTLTLNNSYIPGTALANADFASLTYLSSSGPFAIPTDLPLQNISGTLPAVSGFAVTTIFIDFTGGDTFHFTSKIGNWSVDFDPFGIDDAGAPYAWELRTGAAPEPFTFTLFGTGLLGLALLARRRRKAM